MKVRWCISKHFLGSRTWQTPLIALFLCIKTVFPLFVTRWPRAATSVSDACRYSSSTRILPPPIIAPLSLMTGPLPPLTASSNPHLPSPAPTNPWPLTQPHPTDPQDTHLPQTRKSAWDHAISRRCWDQILPACCRGLRRVLNLLSRRLRWVGHWLLGRWPLCRVYWPWQKSKNHMILKVLLFQGEKMGWVTILCFKSVSGMHDNGYGSWKISLHTLIINTVERPTIKRKENVKIIWRLSVYLKDWHFNL